MRFSAQVLTILLTLALVALEITSVLFFREFNSVAKVPIQRP